MVDPLQDDYSLDLTSLKLAAVRGALLGCGVALLGGSTGFLLGLVAIPLSLVESWLRARPRKRGRDTLVLVGAWAIALAGLLGAYLQGTYTSVFIHQREVDPFVPLPPGWSRPAPPERFDFMAALEAVRIEAGRVWSPFGPHKSYTRPGTGPLMAVCAAAFACAAGLRSGTRWYSLVPLAPTAALFAYWGWKRAWAMGALSGLLALVPFLIPGLVCLASLLACYWFADGITTRLMSGSPSPPPNRGGS